MYDPLRHYIAEGLVVLHSYPHPNDFNRLRGRFLKVRSVVMEAHQPMGPLGGYELRVKHGNVWFSYDVDDDFFSEYTTLVGGKEESQAIEVEWRASMEKAQELIGTL